MLDMLARNWWMLLIRGIAAILFGILVIFLPGLSLAVMVTVLAAYLLVDGFFSVVTAFQSRSNPRWWWQLIEGALGIIAGIAMFLFPIATTLTFFYIVVFWAISTGIIEILSAIQLRKQIDNEWMLILSGVVSIIFGVVLLLNPGEGILTLLWLFGGLSIIFGVLISILAFRLRNLRDDQPTRTAA